MYRWTYLLLSSSMVVVISLCSSSSNLLFWDLFLQQNTQRQLKAKWTDGDKNKETGDRRAQVNQIRADRPWLAVLEKTK